MTRSKHTIVARTVFAALTVASAAVACIAEKAEVLPGEGGGGAGGGGGDSFPLSCASQIDTSLAFAASEAPYGVSLSEWNGRFFQWWASHPATKHPSAGGDCSQKQQDANAFFLPNDNGGISELPACTVPAGQGLLVDLHTQAIFSVPEVDDDCGCFLPDASADAQCLEAYLENILALEDWEVCLEVDGVAVAAPSAMRDYLVWGGPSRYTVDADEPKFPYPSSIPANNCDMPVIPEGTPREVSTWGYFVMLQPLPPGEHEVRFYVIPSDEGREPKGVRVPIVVE